MFLREVWSSGWVFGHLVILWMDLCNEIIGDMQREWMPEKRVSSACEEIVFNDSMPFVRKC